MTRLTEKIDELKVIAISRILKSKMMEALQGYNVIIIMGCEESSYFLDVHQFV